VTVSFDFETNAEWRVLSLSVQNLEGLGINTYSYGLDAVKVTLMDELVRGMLRQTNTFKEMSGFVVSDDVRANMREKIEKRRISQEQLAKSSGNKKRGLFGSRKGS